MKIGSLFTGYGGLDMAVAAVTGGQTVWVSDIDKGANKILAHRYPNIPNLGDISEIDWSTVEPVDILTGGFPCQDLSHAGKRAGLKDGTRSGLWSVMAQAVKELQPRLVVAENVRGLLSAYAPSDVEPCSWCVGDEPTTDLRALGVVLADLADIGYDAQWCGLPASSVGACHPRFRVFLVAYPRSIRFPRDHRPGQRSKQLSRRDFQSSQIEWGDYRKVVAHWGEVVGRPAPQPWHLGRFGGVTPDSKFTEWLMGLPDGWVTDVPGLSLSEQLKALGNGVVPQQAVAALTHMLD